MKGAGQQQQLASCCKDTSFEAQPENAANDALAKLVYEAAPSDLLPGVYCLIHSNHMRVSSRYLQ